MKKSLTIAGLFAVGVSLHANEAKKSDIYYISDSVATTIAVADDIGEIAQIESDAFGAPVTSGVCATPRFTGKPYDDDLGAFVFPFRNYRPDEDRWTSSDPSGFPDGTNSQAYHGRYLSLIDPLGLATINSFMDALNYYASGQGGTVTAGSGLIQTIKNSSDYGTMKQGLTNTLNQKLANVSIGDNSGTISGSGTRSLSDAGQTLGGLVLSLNYSGNWSGSGWQAGNSSQDSRTITASSVPYTFSFSDPWDFQWNNNYGVFKNLFDEVIPGVAANAYATAIGGTGKSFTITGQFSDSITGTANQYKNRE
jgi:RHS repeat-associated protein